MLLEGLAQLASSARNASLSFGRSESLARRRADRCSAQGIRSETLSGCFGATAEVAAPRSRHMSEFIAQLCEQFSTSLHRLVDVAESFVIRSVVFPGAAWIVWRRVMVVCSLWAVQDASQPQNGGVVRWARWKQVSRIIRRAAFRRMSMLHCNISRGIAIVRGRALADLSRPSIAANSPKMSPGWISLRSGPAR